MLALTAAAHAQDEACSPYPPELWQAELSAAREAYAGMQVDRAAGLLDELHRQARCLAAPIAPADLGTFARLQAVRWMYEQDPEGIVSWASLAEHVDPDGAWPVADDHPIRRMVVAEARTPTVAGPKDLAVAHPRRGGVFVDGAFLAEPVARLGEPHLVQVFDADGVRTGGWWQDGAAFRDEILTDVRVPTDPPRWWTGGPAEEEAPRFAAARRDTIGAYRRYLERSPTGEHAAWARRRLDDLEWRAAAEEGTPDAARAYLAAWPEGRNREAAERVLEGEAFHAALAEGTASAFELFRSRHPRGAYSAEANRKLDDLAWMAAIAENTAKAYANYRLRFPRGSHAREARLAQEDLDWTAATANGSAAALQGYLAAWPTGNHADEARVLLAGARFWRVAIGVHADADDRVAKAIEEALAREVAGQGLEVARLPRGASPPTPASGTALVWVVVVPGSRGLEADLELRVPGLARPLAESTVAAEVGGELAERLVEDFPTLGRWSRPPP